MTALLVFAFSGGLVVVAHDRLFTDDLVFQLGHLDIMALDRFDWDDIFSYLHLIS